MIKDNNNIILPCLIHTDIYTKKIKGTKDINNNEVNGLAAINRWYDLS
jgi:hypothetical protein